MSLNLCFVALLPYFLLMFSPQHETSCRWTDIHHFSNEQKTKKLYFFCLCSSKRPACESLLILFREWNRENRTHSKLNGGQKNWAKRRRFMFYMLFAFFPSSPHLIATYNSNMNQPTNYICVLRALAHCVPLLRFIDFLLQKIYMCYRSFFFVLFSTSRFCLL